MLGVLAQVMVFCRFSSLIDVAQVVWALRLRLMMVWGESEAVEVGSSGMMKVE